MKITHTSNPLFPGGIILEREAGEPIWRFEAAFKKFMEDGNYEHAPEAADTEWGKRVAIRPKGEG